MAKITLLMFIAGISVSTCVSADFDIKGVRIGMTKEELGAAHPGLDCGVICYHADTLSSRHAKTLETLAGVHVKTWWFKFAPDGKLTSSSAILRSSSGPVVTSAFIEKFGKPTAVETAEFKTAAGYRGPKQTTSWADGDTVVTVSYPYGKITEMKVEIYSKAQREAEIEAFKSKSKKDL